MQLFTSIPSTREFDVPPEARDLASQLLPLDRVRTSFVPTIDDRVLDVYRRAVRPDDALELRDLWLGRVEHELGEQSTRPALAERWRSSRSVREMTEAEVLSSAVTARFVKELFNWFFRNDLYGDLRSSDHLILSGGSVDEEAWGLPNALKSCIGYALDRDWYGYSDSCGRVPAREAIAAYENERILGARYDASNIAVTMGGTVAVSSIADFVLHASRSATCAPVLCGIPNYPPLVASTARRRDIQLVALPEACGVTSLQPLIEALTPDTPMVFLQSVANPTGARVAEDEFERLVHAASPTTMIVVDECHEWLGPLVPASAARAASNVIRVSSLSKAWSAPGLKLGWIVADAAFITEYYEYASTTFGGPPSFFYTTVELLARMECWLVKGVESVGSVELAELEPSYGLTVNSLGGAYASYVADRRSRDAGLRVLRDAAAARLTSAGTVIRPAYSINTAVEIDGWDDSYRCFREVLAGTGVAVFPGFLNFCLAGGLVRVTTARRWSQLAAATDRLEAFTATRSTAHA